MADVSPQFKTPKPRRAKGRARPNEPLAEWCEFAIVGVCRGAATERHHLLRKSQGGTDDASNTADICAPCHNHAHRNPALAYVQGWMTRSGGNAA